jgi:hypothetical protein
MLGFSRVEEKGFCVVLSGWRADLILRPCQGGLGHVCRLVAFEVVQVQTHPWRMVLV